MQIIREIQLDLKNPAITLPVHAKQNDQLTRYIKAYLYDGGVPFEPPPGTLAMFRAKKPDGTECFYDTNEKGEPAIVIEGNTVTVELAHQVLTRAGKVDAEINLYTSGEERLTSFSFVVQVERSALPDEEILSSDYYNILAKQIAQTLDAAKDAQESAQEIKNLQETVSQTIQQEGAAQIESIKQSGAEQVQNAKEQADRAKEYADSIDPSKFVKSVNGVLPDESGNVEVAAGIGRNLLLNWHFVHPVNQREATAYHNPDTGAIGYHGENIYSIDRWRIHGIWLTLTDEGIELDRISAETAGCAVQQMEESVAKQLSGREMTISALIDGELYTSSFQVPNAEGSLGETVVPTGKMRLYYHPSGTAQFTFDVEPGSQGHILQAAKLEFGSRQTLAHRDEGGEWVLSEIPDYGEELARCQRYAMMYEANGNTLLFMGYGLVDGQFRFTAQTPVVMRIKPTVLKSGLNAASIIDSEGLKAIDTLAAKATSGNTLLMDGMAENVKAGKIYYVHGRSGSRLLLDAEIY